MNWRTSITLENNIGNVWNVINLNNDSIRDQLFPKAKNYKLNYYDENSKEYIHEKNDTQIFIKEIKNDDYFKKISFTFIDKLNNDFHISISLTAEGEKTELQYEGEVTLDNSILNKLLTREKKINDQAVEFCLNVKELTE